MKGETNPHRSNLKAEPSTLASVCKNLTYRKSRSRVAETLPLCVREKDIAETFERHGNSAESTIFLKKRIVVDDVIESGFKTNCSQLMARGIVDHGNHQLMLIPEKFMESHSVYEDPGRMMIENSDELQQCFKINTDTKQPYDIVDNGSSLYASKKKGKRKCMENDSFRYQHVCKRRKRLPGVLPPKVECHSTERSKRDKISHESKSAFSLDTRIRYSTDKQGNESVSIDRFDEKCLDGIR